LRLFPSTRRRTLGLMSAAILAWPVNAYASDMAILMFFFSLPACVVLAGLSFFLAAVVKPSASGVLAIPIGLLVVVHLLMFPSMYHADEATVLAIQAAISSTALLSIPMLRRRKAKNTEKETADQ
jgi:hypothetical protein